MYRRNTDVLAHFDPGEERGSKMQMMSIGPRRFLFNRRDVIEVTEPLKPVMVNKGAYPSGQLQLAYNRRIGKWILMNWPRLRRHVLDAGSGRTGRYDNPGLIKRNIEQKGLRGVRFYDASDPAKLVVLSEWSCDQGDPNRDAGRRAPERIATITTADNTPIWTRDRTTASPTWKRSSATTRTVSRSSTSPIPPSRPLFRVVGAGPETGRGRRISQVARGTGTRPPLRAFTGPRYVPKRVEEGGRYGYSAYGSFGMLVHDLSDIRKSEARVALHPPLKPGAIAFHTIEVARLDREFRDYQS